MIKRLCAMLVGIIATSTPVSAQTAVQWNGAIIERDAAWYGSAEAHRITDTVILHQSAEGGWPKNTSLIVSPEVVSVDEGSRNTFDNQATTLPLAFLAHVISAGERPGDRAAFDRGLDYMLAAQYPNGGWPQFFPLREGYYTHITYNDDAMVRVMSQLRDIAAGQAPYAFVDYARRERAALAVAKGIEVILATQIRQDGQLTVWCAQHDERTLAPAWARRYEPASLSGNESVGITRFLMSIPNPSPDVIAAVTGAVRWLEANAIQGVRFENFTGPDGAPDARVVSDTQAGRLWARFYELETDRPLFMDRQSVARYRFSEIERERRTGYRYYGTWPETLLSQDYPAWRRRVGV